MTLAVAILMKDPVQAKSRLRSLLADDARESLALLLFENTLGFFARFQAPRPLAVITRSAQIAALAEAKGAATVAEAATGGINAAASAAAEWAKAAGADALLIVHADIPTLIDDEVNAILSAGRQAAVVIAESADGGTNALYLSPPDAIPFQFGRNSAAAHEAEARAMQLAVVRLALPYLSRDIDRPDDLARVSTPASAPVRSSRMEGFVVTNLPEIAEGADLAEMIGDALEMEQRRLAPGDIVVIAQKIVSKSEGRLRRLSDYSPSPEAEKLAADIGKDPRKVQAILAESTHIIRAKKQLPEGLLITRHRQGWICANAGIDESNLGHGREGMLLLLPEDADASARRLRLPLENRFGGPIGVIISDTFGRPWRNGLVNIAIGLAGVPALIDWSGHTDAYGRQLKATLPAFADEISAAAGLLMGKDSGTPVVVMRGVAWRDDPATSARNVLRPLEGELFL